MISWYGDRAVRSAEAGIEGFQRLKIPTLLVRGRSTAPWLSATVDVLAARLPNASVVELDGGHACLLESAPEFVAALVAHTELKARQ